jgi:hypothetical protein
MPAIRINRCGKLPEGRGMVVVDQVTEFMDYDVEGVNPSV